MTTRLYRLSTLPLLALIPNLASAHTGAGATHGLVHGLSHPLMGVDHLLAMLAVGMWAIQLGGKATWRVPFSFVSVMAIGGSLGLYSAPLPVAETGVMFSLLVFGLLIAAAVKLPSQVGALIVGFFALFHGITHGTEIPSQFPSGSYIAGFLISTLVLHMIGMLIAIQLKKAQRSHWLRWGGASIALVGSSLLMLG